MDKGVQYSKHTDTLIIQMPSWRREENMVRHLKDYPFNLKFQQLSITLSLLDWTKVSDFISFVTSHWWLMETFRSFAEHAEIIFSIFMCAMT